ncbi:hypothetical protein AMAG_18069 [Allomyces macrogynus ATCC 38327]|uniref:Uncharacterized protein n=1 Tax=Allomyces macrogynus (strain ATCC 38327) TaxID=578462 RepID=A0A0L0S545_ALLM3|nr:hypothetical protein AMAG_18069 [Allomyces macrogynus ATCC 38327]|eukprot:KNE57575.1 hypothetical protein AMAG_18069 [Allomyces macrogynus ATCC 38327]
MHNARRFARLVAACPFVTHIKRLQRRQEPVTWPNSPNHLQLAAISSSCDKRHSCLSATFEVCQSLSRAWPRASTTIISRVAHSRALTERMRFLGYPKLISVEAFRQPNFELVSELLVWLVKSQISMFYDPQADISVDISTEAERVNLVKTVAQFLASKAQPKLNLRKLYAGDGTAVKELLKLTDLFMAAQRVLDDDARGVSTTPATSKTIDLASKLATITAARDLASDITNRGAVLFDLLGQELENRELRSQVLARPSTCPPSKLASARLYALRKTTPPRPRSSST